jgi:hypothetical protein
VKTTKQNTLTTTVEGLIQVLISEGDWTAEEGSLAHAGGWANTAYHAVEDCVLAADYDAGGGQIGLLILAYDQEATLEALAELGFGAEAAPLAPKGGKSRYGDGHFGTVDVWRDGDEVLLVEGSQPLG